MKKFWLSFLWMFALCCFVGCGAPSAEEPTTAGTVSDDAPFEIYFFDVGQADSALILCDGESMLIDGGNMGDGDMVVSSLQSLGLNELDAVVSTHSDEDHIGGLPDVLEAFDVGTLYVDGNPASTKIYQRFCDIASANSLAFTNPSPGDTFDLGDSIVTFLGPISMASDPNENSIVLRIDYGETSYLFTGDAMRKEEKELVEAGADLAADVLKVAHHGGAESTNYVFLREVMPEYAVISVGEGNKYGHPTEEALSRLRDVGAAVYRTDELGTIICRSDGVHIEFINSTDQRMPEAESNRADEQIAVDEDAAYIGNINSKKFHLPSCSSLPEEQNAIYFASCEEALSQGYEPCGKCHP